MSLLMDALKKAELAKRQGQGDASGASKESQAKAGLSLEPIAGSTAAAIAPAAEDTPSSGTSSGNLPHLPSHLEELDAQFLAEAKQAAAARLKTPQPVPIPDQTTAAADVPVRAAAQPSSRPAPAKQNGMQQQTAAQNLFAAKQADKPPARKSFAIAIGVLTVLSVCGIGGYFWWQLQPKTPLGVARTAPLPPPPASTPVSTSAAVPPAPTAAALPVATAGLTPPPAAQTGVRPATPAADDKDDDFAPAVTKTTAQTRRTGSPAAAPAESEGPVRVTRAPLKVNPALIRGFDAFNRGDLAVAQNEYERAQKSDPRNTDALHGLAAIAVRQGRLDQAESLYRRIAEADPHDVVAMSALINMRGQIDPGAAESRLKSLSADQPELAAPHFSLGNLYARHGRWNEAQQAYFKAYTAEPDNPDIIYNLAISLEQLRQNKLAAQYYSQAIAAAQTRTVGFDKVQAAARLRTLQP